jgi:hypothetical protein
MSAISMNLGLALAIVGIVLKIVIKPETIAH